MSIIVDNLWAQILGFIVLFLGIASFLQKKDVPLKGLLSVQSFVLAVHYLLMGAYTGAVASSISGIRNFLSIWTNLKPFAFVFITLYVVIGFLNYDQWYDFLPLAASIFSTYALFYLNGLYMRYVFLLSISFYLVFNVLVGSIGPAIMESVQLCVNMVTIYRLKADEKY